ncbi:MAG: sigma-54 dependent transcriptional regulator, partial [Gemmatimonadota bacterium]
IVEWTPGGGEQPPSGAALHLLLAGGAETDAIDRLAELPGGQPRYVIGALADHRVAVAALQQGARDYFALPEDLDLLRRTIEREARQANARRAAEKFAAGERKAWGFDAILGQSAPLRRTIEQAQRVTRHRDVTVLLGGETGTGKELLARAIHYEGPRATEPFVDINCAAIPHQLLESELFGHEKGSFTGAVAAKPGLFELAHGGTLFLDEIGTLPMDLQPKLLRALENREVRRVGGRQSRLIDVRVIAATHLNLSEAVERGEFRADLYYRLNVVALVLPPLRDRGEDIELLAETMLARLAAQYGLPVPPFSPEARAALRSHPWPGNVRELKNAIERALVLSPPGAFRLEQLDRPAEPVSSVKSPVPFPARLDQITRSAVVAMLTMVDGNKSEAARRLAISRPRIQRILDDVTTD